MGFAAAIALWTALVVGYPRGGQEMVVLLPDAEGKVGTVVVETARGEQVVLNSAYATSKVALNQFTRHLAAELEGTGVTANVIHPGDVKTEMWATIRAEAERLGPEAEAYRKWVRWVEQTGGDDPQKAADLVLRLSRDEAAGITGQFLWIEGGLQSPIPSWGEPTTTQPWREWTSPPARSAPTSTSDGGEGS